MGDVYNEFKIRSSPWSISQAYDAHYNRHSDFFGHMPYCRDVSRGKSVVELGFRWGQSTAGFLSSEGAVRSFDIEDCLEGREIFDEVAQVSNLDWSFTKADSLEVELDGCDILFIDTLHTGAQVYQELHRHHGAVNNGGLIIMHDTGTFVDMQFGVQQFLEESATWRIKHHFKWCHGLTVLERI